LRIRKWWLAVPVSIILLTSSCAPAPGSSTTEVLAGGTDGWTVPSQDENSDHGYLLADSRIPRLATCDEWVNFWITEGPAVSFEVASVYDEPNMAVSTQIYLKNKHLDKDKDGVLCFFEGESKPLAVAGGLPKNSETESGPTPKWIDAALSVRSSINSEFDRSYPLDFSVSPNVVADHAETIRAGVELALKFWGPYIESNRPLAMTVVHPKDKAWFLDRWNSLGRDNTGEFWWNLAKGGGGGAVGWTEAGIPNMYFMTSESFAPPKGRVDYYVHEVTHFFQTLSLGADGEAGAPCWYPEGTANFIGFSMIYPEDEARTIYEFATARKERAKILMDFYKTVGGLSNDRLERDILKFPPGDPTCQHENPQFGYNLGMFVAEKLIIDHGFESFIEMTKKMASQSLSKAFETVNRVSYEEWVRDEVFPYITETLVSESH
jgi:hypothetical protein